MQGPLSCGTLSAAPAGSSTDSVSTSLSLSQGDLYSFVLAGSPTNTGTDAILQLTLLDASGNVVSTLYTPANLAASTILCLPAGNYTLVIKATSPSGQSIPSLAYSLAETDITNPIKVYSSPGSNGGTGGK